MDKQTQMVVGEARDRIARFLKQFADAAGIDLGELETTGPNLAEWAGVTLDRSFFVTACIDHKGTAVAGYKFSDPADGAPSITARISNDFDAALFARGVLLAWIDARLPKAPEIHRMLADGTAPPPAVEGNGAKGETGDAQV